MKAFCCRTVRVIPNHPDTSQLARICPRSRCCKFKEVWGHEILCKVFGIAKTIVCNLVLYKYSKSQLRIWQVLLAVFQSCAQELHSNGLWITWQDDSIHGGWMTHKIWRAFPHMNWVEAFVFIWLILLLGYVIIFIIWSSTRHLKSISLSYPSWRFNSDPKWAWTRDFLWTFLPAFWEFMTVGFLMFVMLAPCFPFRRVWVTYSCKSDMRI